MAVKSNKDDVKLKEKKQDKSKTSSKTSLKKVPQLISFDAYFQGLMRTDSKIYLHHKAPMKKYANKNGLSYATLEQFEKLFKAY